ncbi:hypothetical protein O4H52_04155 [Sphingomonadaceae bacterium G21617-S1]|jgi:hypothetical protein|uniref:hypothetical protein n=1 Tax=Rhizorhabdus sp. TaxID=1968843 RepID=UPI001206C06E|nr:hypothetical protein [Rhizorhabdus sp.]MBD3760328.1 hypothetical protein [Rhizorhabdus sp.]MCZ4340784.1 hypothetical protein [Sphingomonadaceae bacterium G21617-S1]TAK16797.1 MAG: hypothetical protein EPO38_01660 [Rhizorhabdus sp.]
MHINTESVPDRLHPTLKLFLSADIVGSTALKQPFDLDKPDDADSFRLWSSTIKNFYVEMTKAFLREQWDQRKVDVAKALYLDDREAASAKHLLGPPPVIWKTIGDEIIFTKDLTDDLQIWIVLEAWLAATTRVRNSLRTLGVGRGAVLDLKSTAWLAGFPVRNHTVYGPSTGEDSSRAGNVDYIGPAIDIGFRLCQLSTAQRFHLSVDVVYFLSSTTAFSSYDDGLRRYLLARPGRVEEQFGTIQVYFGGTEYLRGVMGGTHYPKFWLDVHHSDSLEKTERDLVKPPQMHSDWAALKIYCEKFYEDRKKFLFKPFINGKSFSASTIHGNYQRFFDQVVGRMDFR